MNEARYTSDRGRASSIDKANLQPAIFSDKDDDEAAIFFARLAEMFPSFDLVRKLESELDTLTAASARHLRYSIDFRKEAEAVAARLAVAQAAKARKP